MALVTRKPERVRELEDLIAALDRRVPRVERAGEAPSRAMPPRCGSEPSIA